MARIDQEEKENKDVRQQQTTSEKHNNKEKQLTLEEFQELCDSQAKSSKQILKEIWTIISTTDNITDLTIDNILHLANITYKQYKKALETVTNRNFIYHRRDLKDCSVNNYNADLLRAWNANLDIQFVTDAYSCVAYILSYISKAESEMGDLLQNAKKEAEEGNKDVAATMTKIGQVYIQNREVSAQEAVYRVCSFHLKDFSRNFVFIPTGSKPLKMSLPINLIKSRCNSEQEDDNVWMISIIEKYYTRPDNEEFDKMCLTEFGSNFIILPRSTQTKYTLQKSMPVFELQRGLGYIKQKTVGKENVVRYPRFNRNKQSEEYYMTLVQLYLPHRSLTVKPDTCRTYEEFVGKPEVIDIINENRHRFELDADDLEKAWENPKEGKINEDACTIIAPEAEAERLDIELEKNLDVPLEEEDVPELEIIHGEVRHKQNVNPSVEYHRPQMTQKQIHEMMRGAGTGKTHLIKCIYHEVTRILSKACDNPESEPIMLTAPTGTAAFNVDGQTIHSAFAISKNIKLPYTPLAENILKTLRTKFENLHILVIDEISMVDQKLLSYIHGRLCQFKQSTKYFGNISVLAVGDFCQLPPVKASPLYKTKTSNFADLWNPVFSIATLTEVMRQKEDIAFASMLNRLRFHIKGVPLDASDLEMLSSVSYQQTPEEAKQFLHVYPTNKQVDQHNESMVEQTCNPVLISVAKDYYKNLVTGQTSQRETSYTSCSNEDLESTLKLGIGARIVLTRNIATNDGLVNGAFGTVIALDTTSNADITALYIKFDNLKSGKKHISKTVITNPTGKNAVRIIPIEETLHDRNSIGKQFPLKLGWAATIHKVQWMTVKDIVVSLKKTFQAGMAYVALSRATSLPSLRIIDFDETVIYASDDITKALDSMEPFLKDSTDHGDMEQPSLSILLHNTEGLIPHQTDIHVTNLKLIQTSDIVCFTET